MFVPVVLYFSVFKYIPMAGIVIAFKNFKISQGIFGSAWCGFDNFSKAFRTATFGRSVTNTLTISGLKLLFGFPAPILLALMLNEVTHLRFKKTVQTISYLPHFLSWVVLAGMFQQLLSPNNGAVNAVLRDVFGVKESIYFLGSNDYFRGTLIATDLWKNVGWSSILYLATIAGIDPTLYEADPVAVHPLHHASLPGQHHRDYADPQRRLHHGRRVRSGVQSVQQRRIQNRRYH